MLIDLASAAPSTAQSRPRAILITGANGEIGHGLIRRLYELGERHLVALDLRDVAADLKPCCLRTFAGDICEQETLDKVYADFDYAVVFHLAAFLSTKGEHVPETAHRVNVDGTLNLLERSARQGQAAGAPVRFIFPSSIAVYGIPNLNVKSSLPPVSESQFLEPVTMYGCNKLSCEHLGRYYARHYRQLDRQLTRPGWIDFRSVRLPGLISAFTMPTGGTSDYAPEMIHAAAQGKPYPCFVREDAAIPFLAMPDAVEAIIRLAQADASRLTRCVYNMGGFSPTAGEIAALVRKAFPDARITFEPHKQRQAIVDSWPARVDDAAARSDWQYSFEHDFLSAFNEYLIPNIRAHYASARRA